MKPFGIAATLSDAVALTASAGNGTKIAIGVKNLDDSDILAPAGLTLQPQEAAAAMKLGRPQYIFTFGNTPTNHPSSMLGPVMDLLASASGTDFCAGCFAAPWLGRTVYQGHLFQDGRMQADLKRELAPYLDGAIAIVANEVIAAGHQAIRNQLTALKERGVRLALLDAIDEEQCGLIADALARQPVIAGPAWLRPQAEPEDTLSLPRGSLAILSGALNRQTLMQTAAARLAMPVLDLDLSNTDPQILVAQALAWAMPYSGAPFLIATSASPDRIHAGAPAAEILGKIAKALAGHGTRNFLAAGNDTAAAIIDALGIRQLTAGAAFAGLRWLQDRDINILIKPGSFGSKNLFLYDFEPQSRLNESAE